ncbi:MAG: DUF4337 domain-containing protein [Rhizomicrobium sp.]|jgi:hypothetical protein
MEIEAKSANARLNTWVATTVLIISVFLAVEKLKDDNLVRNMSRVKTDSVDVWNQYQAARIKLHLDENASAMLTATGPTNSAAVVAEQQRLSDQITKYTNESAQLFVKARGDDVSYDELAFHHDQFDLSDAFLAIALALTAVAALSEAYWLMIVGWGFGALGLLMGISGFAGWSVHPDLLMRLLG